MIYFYQSIMYPFWKGGGGMDFFKVVLHLILHLCSTTSAGWKMIIWLSYLTFQ